MTVREATVGASDIARLAGVGRAAVSNWRRRFTDFPQPVGGSSASPLFRLSEVGDWLTRHGKPFRLTVLDHVWQALRGAAGDLELGDRIGYLGGFLAYQQRSPASWKALVDQPDALVLSRLTEDLAAVVPEFVHLVTDTPGPDAVTILRLAAEAADRESPHMLLDFLCERYLEVHSRRHRVAPARVVDLMVALTGATGRILDPACGIGTLLLAAQAAGATEMCGQEGNPTAARLAHSRLLLTGGHVQVAVADSLHADAFPGELFDAVLCNPPFGDRSWGYGELTGDNRWAYGLPPRGESELAWAQHCLAHVRPGGHVAILMPAAAAQRGSGRRIRANLLRAGALRAVFSLPGWGTMASGGPHLWLLQRPDGANHAHVFLWDGAADREMIESGWRSFLAEPETPRPGPCVSVRILDLLDEYVDLTPARHLGGRASTSATVFQPARTRLGSAARTLADTLPDLRPLPAHEPPPTTTVGELARAGVVSIRQAPMALSTVGGDRPVLTARDVRLGRAASGAGSVVPGAVELRPGDVVALPPGRHAAVQVVADCGTLLGPQLLLFRADPQRLDAQFLAGCLRAVTATGRASSSSARTDVHRMPLPRLPIEIQREYGRAFRMLSDFQQSAREVAELAESLVALGFSGLADGRLRPGGETNE
ncbi:N-6 DNA methylase [Micromonospora aurantiaca]|uniref:HsdM family class I SAM-dependent methyltransferase n=1 Tax=Micromonospora aurantiaca (nom. illeg.) TaxID=47850 RepID=UPI0033E3A008